MKYIGILYFVFLIAITILGPLASIFALNTVFNLNITYGIYEWLAMLWLHWVFMGSHVTAIGRLVNK